MQGGAVFDDSGRYRYLLWRQWHESPARTALFIMLNPSTADANHDDPTIRRCIAFARDWGFGRLEVVNLFAFCATSPRDLKLATAPTGPGNAAFVAAALRRADLVVAAWGCHRLVRTAALELIDSVPLSCLGVTSDGSPRHPLYVRGDAQPVPFRPAPTAA